MVDLVVPSLPGQMDMLARIVGEWATSLGSPGVPSWLDGGCHAWGVGDDRLAVLAVEGDRVLGFASAATVRALPWPGRTDSGYAHLDGLYVLPEQRRRGIAASLMTALADIAAEAGLRAIDVQADPEAMAFYASQGFRPVGNAMKLGLSREGA